MGYDCWVNLYPISYLEFIMALEREFLAMRQIDRAFKSLESDHDRERVAKWATDKYGEHMVPTVKVP